MRNTAKSIAAAALAAGYEPVTLKREGNGIFIDAADGNFALLHNTRYSDLTMAGWLEAVEALVGPVRMVERKNLMTGKLYMEPHNTPSFMSPACESYWTN